ncbi:hypothetical protein CYMTET_33637 [Cymbomonas tetramitiformis]|uniref:Polycystin cation channel PKD1/PKD2 domain-containing protein n=1 Tax=Cymbomonas tetramitiformis TaxID=36881 RepID=A0AAE0KQZ7_9CHLO|nr:hypothetical protein CYMTET_33637 [Cymbomonas tetramitiformis]
MQRPALTPGTPSRMQVRYMISNGLHAFFLMLRIMKLCDFQPRMGIITRTLAVAASDLYHFFIILFVVFMNYVITGHLVFGATVEGFSDIAKSSNTLFNMMVFGDNSVVEELVGLSEPSMNAIASIFYMSYALLVVMVLLNFLLAIVMDSFAIVKEASKVARRSLGRLCPLVGKCDLLGSVWQHGNMRGATAIGEELCYYGKAYIDQRRNQAMPDQTALNYLQSLREGQQRALKATEEVIKGPTSADCCPAAAAQELDLDKAWEETILVRGKAIESLSGAQVKQALLEAAAAADNPRIEAGGAQKEDDVVRVFDIDAEEAEEKQNAVAVARKVMEKFGLREDVDDADEEKMQQKQQTQQIFDMLQMLTLQVQEVMAKQKELEETMSPVQLMQSQLQDIQTQLGGLGARSHQK